MAVKHEIKSQLAKLLATEDLIVENKSVETASFNTHTRVLTLPNWDRASNNVYDTLVTHEVGHALYTPDRDWYKEIQIPPSFVNIVEDVRIEKLMKRRYAGLSKCFYTGYHELNDQDFFSINDKDLTDFNIADRVNLYFKVGAWNDISFSDVETPIVRLIENAETFDETLTAAQALYNLCKEELENKQTENIDADSEIEIEGGGNIPNDSGEEESEEEEEVDYQTKSQDTEDEEEQLESQSESQSKGGFKSEPQVETVDALEENIKDLTDIHSQHENVYVELPKLNLKEIIIDNEFIHNNLNLSWVNQQKEWDNMIKERKIIRSSGLYDEVDRNFIEFKRNAQKEVNYLVKEFECKKAASSYARATTARTGVLDTSKLHTYKYNEDLFKKVTTLAEGKNHGLIFVLDWSGSMSGVMLDTIKQLYNLLWFCKKVNIPFEVYAFTNDHPPVGDTIHKLAYEKKEGLALVSETFSMLNLFTSKTKNKDLQDQMKSVFRLASAFSYSIHTEYYIPVGMNLSGTPLNEAIISLHQILPQFKNNNNVEKVQCVILTDGEACSMMYSKHFERYDNDSYLGSNYIGGNCILRNRKTGYTYSCEGLGRWADITNLLLKDLRQTFSNTNLIGIRVLSSRDASQFVRHYAGYEGDAYDKIMTRWRKEKSFTIKNSGYNSYFGLSASALANDDEFEVQEDATKAQIKRAFFKSLKNKKMNKKILGEFIELVA